jgi:hypothetical protein
MKKLNVLLFPLFSAFVAIAQEPIKWETIVKATGGNEYDIILKATLKKGCYIYSQFTPEGAQIPSKFDFSANKHIDLVGKMKEKSLYKNDEFDPIFEVRVIKFSNEVTFIQHIKAKENKPLKITTEYMICDDKSCQPFFDNEYTVVLPDK